jgi:hypothetical protein
MFMTTTLIAGVGGFALIGSGEGQQPVPEAINPKNIQPSTPSHRTTVAYMQDPCHYSNPSDIGGGFASQFDPVYPFWAEFADDFMLTDPNDPDGLNPCQLDQVSTGFSFFNNPAGVDPGQCWSGVKLTVYEDIGAGMPNGDPPCPLVKGPGGYPASDGSDAHFSCLVDPPGVVCELTIPMSQVLWVPDPTFGTPDVDFVVDLIDLGQFECVLEKNHKYWIAMAPIQEFGVCGQTAVYVSTTIVEHEGQLIFELLGIPWTPGTELGNTWDVGMEIFATKVTPPPTGNLDIKPGSCPNPLNVRSRGVLPVGLLGTDTFDATLVDIASLEISRADGVGGSVGPIEGPPGPHTVLADVGTPFGGELCDCHELEGDGIVDVSMHFSTPMVVSALELDGEATDTFLELCVTGTLLDGTPFMACDCVRIINRDIADDGSGSAAQ